MSVPNSRWRTGNATPTTVPSMKVMLDPRMVAASTQGAAAFEQGAAAVSARITASSHGALALIDKLVLSSSRTRCASSGCQLKFPSERFDEEVVHVAVAPLLARLERLDDGVLRGVKVFGGVPVRRAVTAADVPARLAEPQVNPTVARLQTVLTTACARRDFTKLAEVRASSWC